MGLLTGTMTNDFDLSAEIDHYSDLNDKLRAGKISATERKELRSIRKRMSVA